MTTVVIWNENSCNNSVILFSAWDKLHDLTAKWRKKHRCRPPIPFLCSHSLLYFLIELKSFEMKQFITKVYVSSRYILTVNYIILTYFNDLITTFLSDLVSKTLKKLLSLWKKCSFLTRLTGSLMGNSFRITISLQPFFSCYPIQGSTETGFCTFSWSRMFGYKVIIHSVSYVYAVLPFYDVKCLCSGGREWGREESHSH